MVVFEWMVMGDQRRCVEPHVPRSGDCDSSEHEQQTTWRLEASNIRQCPIVRLLDSRKNFSPGSDHGLYVAFTRS